MHTTAIVKYFKNKCNDSHVPFKYLGFLIINVLHNVEHLSENDTESSLLQNENFRIKTLVTQHKRRNGSHD